MLSQLINFKCTLVLRDRMDDSLLAELQSFSVGTVINDTKAPHPHYALYKQKREGYGDQEARRKKLLRQQKLRRENYADYVRRIVNREAYEEMEEEEEEGGGFDEVDKGDSKEDTMQVSKGDGSAKNPGQFKRRHNPYRNQLMLSEWLVDVPEDFEENWLMVVCPVGRRSLVISSRATTTAYSRVGQLLNNFPSYLPGGHKRTYHNAGDHCILDCIYHETSRTYYVLDVMCWNGHPVYDSDTNFRTFWAKTKLAEEGEKVSTHSRINPLRFLCLDYYPCSRDSIVKVLSSKWPVEVDGLLFIHKEAHYTVGCSPLAVWLKPHMVPDLLKLPVSEEFLACAPTLSDVKMDTDSSEAQVKKKKQTEEENMDSGSTNTVQ